MGCHLFYLSADLVSPLFFVNLPTNFFPSGVTPLEGVTWGTPLVTPLYLYIIIIIIIIIIKIYTALIEALIYSTYIVNGVFIQKHIATF